MSDCVLRAHAVRSDDEQIEAGPVDADTEVDCVHRAILTDQRARRGDVGRRLERQRRWIGGAVEPRGGKGLHRARRPCHEEQEPAQFVVGALLRPTVQAMLHEHVGAADRFEWARSPSSNSRSSCAASG